MDYKVETRNPNEKWEHLTWVSDKEPAIYKAADSIEFIAEEARVKDPYGNVIYWADIENEEFYS